MAKGGGTKTAEQMNTERRAAKQRQQAQKKAASVHRTNNQVFVMTEAIKDSNRRKYTLQIQENERRRQEEQLKRDSETLLQGLKEQGAVFIPATDPNYWRRARALETAIRNNSDPNCIIEYNRDAQGFRAAVVKGRKKKKK